MKKTFLLFSLFFVLLVPSTVRADGAIMPPPDRNVTQASQTALIVYQDGVEDLILSIQFYGDAEEFGWIVPVPARPEVTEADDELFGKLGELTQPKKDLLERIKGESRYGGFGIMEASAVGKGEEDVTVIETKRVGILDVSVLESRSSRALLDWLEDNGYQLPVAGGRVEPILEDEEMMLYPREELTQINRPLQVIQEYLDDGWYFVVAKINAEFLASPPEVSDEELPQRAVGEEAVASPEIAVSRFPVPPYPRGQAHITPLRLTFETPKMVYPMKITSLGGEAPSVLLYVWTEGKVAVANYPQPYRGEEDSVGLFDTTYAALAKAEELSEWLPELESGYLTKLYASYVPAESMTSDIRFEEAEDTREVGTGKMTLKKWLLVPVYLSVYGPTRIVRLVSGRYYFDLVSSPQSMASIFGVLGIFGLLWAALCYLLLTRTRKKRKRLVLYLLQLPGVWLFASLLSLIVVVPYNWVGSLVGADAEVTMMSCLWVSSLGTTAFAVLLYRLQAGIHRFVKHP